MNHSFIVVQYNLQKTLGGGEIYTAFLTRALEKVGLRSLIVTDPRAEFWNNLDLGRHSMVVSAQDSPTLEGILRASPSWLLGHGPLPPKWLAGTTGHFLSAIAHMPVEGSNYKSYEHHHLVFPVSRWVSDGFANTDIPIWQEPFLGVADLRSHLSSNPIRRRSRYAWDTRKVRDRALGILEKISSPLFSGEPYLRRPGLVLGIVSRITPIKQFPELFRYLSPVIARYPTVRLEIFGAGGFASVRDLDHALRPCRSQVRFWGQQSDIASVYGSIDALLTGLPEREALGLNVIEAQFAKCVVLAVDSPPFVDTVADGISGFRYPDPRSDHGRGFENLLQRLLAGERPIFGSLSAEHLSQFSFESFVGRIYRASTFVAQELRTKVV